MRLKNYFKVYRNGVFLGETETASLREIKKSIKTGELYAGDRIVIGTHMGEMRRAPTGYRYYTTVGVNLDFVRFAKEVAV